MGHYNHSLSLGATIMVSQNYPIIREYVVNSYHFHDTMGYHNNSMIC